jgi:hypothetical protein
LGMFLQGEVIIPCLFTFQREVALLVIGEFKIKTLVRWKNRELSVVAIRELKEP